MIQRNYVNGITLNINREVFYFFYHQFLWQVSEQDNQKHFQLTPPLIALLFHQKQRNEQHLAPALRNADNKNAYTKTEIQEMIKAHKKNGKLEEAISRFKKRS